MNKQLIKVIKRNDGPAKPPVSGKARKERAKKKPSLESTVKTWITERRENDEAEQRSSVDAWNTDTPAEAV